MPMWPLSSVRVAVAVVPHRARPRARRRARRRARPLPPTSKRP